MADRPHGSSASSDADWFSHTSRERTGGRHHAAAPPSPPTPPRRRAAAASEQTPPPAGTGHRRTRTQPSGPRRTGTQHTATPYHAPTGEPDARTRHATSQHTGSFQARAPHPGSHHTGSYDTGSQHTGPRNTASHDTGSHQTGHHTGSYDSASRYTASRYTEARRIEPEDTGSWHGEPRQAGRHQLDRDAGSRGYGLTHQNPAHQTGTHQTGTHQTGTQAHLPPQATGPQPYHPRSRQQHDMRSRPTDPHPSTQEPPAARPGRTAAVQWGHEAATPRDAGAGRIRSHPVNQRHAATPYPEEQPYDVRWATGPQPADFGRFLEPGADGHWDAGHHVHDRHDTGHVAPGPHTGQFASGHHPDQSHPSLHDPYEEDAYPDPARPTRAAAGLDPAQTRPPATQTRARTQRHRAARTARAVAVGLAIAVLLATGFGWGTKRWAQSRFKQVAALELGSSAIVNGAAQRGDDNFLVLGLDGRPGAEAEDPAGGARADTAMVVHVPQDRGRVVVVSFPSDLLVDRPACEGWDADRARYTGQHDPGQPKAPLSTAYRAGGPRCVTRVVQQLSGLAINHFVGIDFAGFRSVVDAMGGVQLCAEQPLHDGVLGEVIAAPGNVRLSGEQALAFVRASHVAADPPGGHGRVLRQQQLLAAVARAATSDGGPDAHKVVDALAGSTLVDNVDVDQLLGLATALNQVDPGRLAFVPAPANAVPANPAPANAGPDAAGTAAGETLRSEDAAALFTALVDGTPLPGERPGPQAPASQGGPQLATVAPAEIKLQVQNGTGQDGLATQIAKRLRGVGFEVVQLGNAGRVDRTVIRFGTSREAQARSVSAAVPRAALQLDPAMGGAIEVVIGNDFDGAIQPVQPGQPVPGQPVEAAPAAAPIQLDIVNGTEGSCS